MSHEFDAIYEQGVFRPLERVDLPEQTKVHLQIQEAAEGAPATLTNGLSGQKVAFEELLAWMNGRPKGPADQPLSARDHDRILYGWQK